MLLEKIYTNALRLVHSKHYDFPVPPKSQFEVDHLGQFPTVGAIRMHEQCLAPPGRGSFGFVMDLVDAIYEPWFLRAGSQLEDRVWPAKTLDDY